MRTNPLGRSVEWEDMLFEKEDERNVSPLDDEDVIILSGDFPLTWSITKSASKGTSNRSLPFYIVNILDDDD